MNYCTNSVLYSFLSSMIRYPHICSHTHARTNTSTDTNTHRHKHTRMHTHTHTHRHKHTHTHAHTELIGWDPLFLAHRPHFSLEVRTRSPEGLLFFAATRRGNSHLAVYMSKGRIRFSVGKQKEIFNREKYNDGKWHTVSEHHVITKQFQ